MFFGVFFVGFSRMFFQSFLGIEKTLLEKKGKPSHFPCNLG